MFQKNFIFFDKKIPILTEVKKIKHSYGAFRNKSIRITLSSHLSDGEKEEVFEKLLRKVAGNIPRMEELCQDDKKLETSFGSYRFEILHEKNMQKRFFEVSKNTILVSHHVLFDGQVKKFIEKQLWEYFELLLVDFCKNIHEHYFSFHPFPKVRFQKQESRWGSFSKKTNSIRISKKLLFAPSKILRYVCVHELAHLKYAGHGRRFWGLVEKADKDFKNHRRWLRDFGFSLDFYKIL